MENWYRCPGCAVLLQREDRGEIEECPLCGASVSKDNIEKGITVRN